MKKSVFAAAALITLLTAATQAHADGWRCQTVEGDLNVTVYDHTQPTAGTRNAAIMIFSNPANRGGIQTIATFQDVDQTMSNRGMSYTAFASQAVDQGAIGGKYIAGTRLMYVKSIDLVVDTNYAAPAVPNGAVVGGALYFEQLNGANFARRVNCARYLKN